MKLSFDKSNPAEALRAGRVVKDMLRRGYALLVEVERDGQKAFERALDFKEETSEYIVADLDVSYSSRDKPSVALGNDDIPEKEDPNGEGGSEEEAVPAVEQEPEKKHRGRPRKGIPASGTRAVAVGRSAGG